MHVALLGPLEVRTDGDPGEIVEVAGARLRALLIMLALHPGQLVTASQLIDGLWPQEMPAGAGNALQALVSRLRRALPEAVLESCPAGYQLNIDPRPAIRIRGWPRSLGSCAGTGRSTSVSSMRRRKRISWPRRASWPS